MSEEPPAKTLDLQEAILDTLMGLEDRGEPASVTMVLRTIGVAMAPTLRHGGTEDGPSPALDPEGLVRLGRFHLLGELGRGGMGRVLEARDPELRRTVAVKVVIDPREVTEAQLSRFVAEAQITSQLEHPNIVPVYEMGVTAGGDLYFAMKKVVGRSLRKVLGALRGGDSATAAEWGRHRLLTAFIQVCHAVAYAHDRGVLHRDLKPENIMLGPFGEVLLMDWGVARLMGDTSEVLSSEPIERVAVARTMDGVVIGTPGFMSPEQWRGDLHRLDARSDVWSLGAVLYEVLTLERAYEAPDLYSLMHRTMSGPPVDPRERTPMRDIPEEMVAICLRALATERDERFATASALGSAVEAFLEGSKRREAAQRHLAEAEAAWARYRALAAEGEDLRVRERVLDEALDPWASLEEKRELLAARERLSGIGPDRARRLAEVLTLCDKAFSQDPGNSDARALLATVHYARLEEAEAERDEEDRLFHEGRLREFDDGRYATLLKGTGALTLRTDPPGAEVVCERYDDSARLVWPLVERRVLGRTPLERLPLEQGSYLLTLRCPGKRDTRYPVFIPRGRHWDSGDDPVALYSDAEIGGGMVYVPPGPFVWGGGQQYPGHAAGRRPGIVGVGAGESVPRSGAWVDGFFLSPLPVTMQGYCDFINALNEKSPEQAWRRVPRQESGRAGAGQYWERPAPGEAYRVIEVDRDGDRWDPNWAVHSVSGEDAMAYVAWQSERDGLLWSLPTEQQWEKAARGTDGRVYPWGDDFDPTMCKMRASRPGRAQPEVVGAFAADISPYGVRDMAGGVRTWCGHAHPAHLAGLDLADGESFDGVQGTMQIRGGSWATDIVGCRTTTRSQSSAWLVFANNGFRLARATGPSGSQNDG